MPPAPAPLLWHAYHLPKRGNSEEEYEDAFAAHPERGRFAIADGASESSFARQWARLLAEGFVLAARKPFAGPGWVEPLRRRWAEEVDGLPLPWYAEMKREQGAFATFLGLALRPPAGDKPGRWRALAAGDSCLFQVRGFRLLKAFPLANADDFGNQPPLIGSRPTVSPTGPVTQSANGPWKTGDLFFLMTDALAQWFLRRHERQERPWDVLPSSSAEGDAFAVLVEELRSRQELRNDDTTMISVRHAAATTS